MFDIKFYQKIFRLKEQLMAGARFDREELFERFEACRSEMPVLYNIETTNACNMSCIMCPRTKLMTRPVETIKDAVYEKVIDQITPFSETDWNQWEDFCELNYGVSRNAVSENHFFLYVIPKVVVLHGYGEPLLDPNIVPRVRQLTERGIPSYFSCNPSNIDLEKITELFGAGLSFIKFSMESVSDATCKDIRGNNSDFSGSYGKLRALFKIKEKGGFKTRIVITMLDLGRPGQDEEFGRLREAFEGQDVYLYLKSKDQRWYADGEGGPTASLHWSEFCQFPWASLSVQSNGEVTACAEDYNNEIILGDAKTRPLREIWNSAAYRDLRRAHFDLRSGIKCLRQCDMKLAGNMNCG